MECDKKFFDEVTSHFGLNVGSPVTLALHRGQGARIKELLAEALEEAERLYGKTHSVTQERQRLLNWSVCIKD